MNHKVEPFNDFGVALGKLKVAPENVFCFVPENFGEAKTSTDFIYPESVTDIRKVLKSANIKIGFLADDKPLLRARKFADWFGPTLFIGFSFLAENSDLISVSLNLISSYLYDVFKGNCSGKNVKFDIIIETKEKKEYTKLSYDGNIEGMKELGNIIKQLKK